jgi:hypothetical protein
MEMEKILVVAEYFKGDNVHNIDNVKRVLLDNDFIIKKKESKGIVKVSIFEDKSSMKYKELFAGSSCESESECWEVIFSSLTRYFKENY